MRLRRPGVISTRAVNQYRKRDVIGYLGARYLLNSVSAQSDEWATKIAVDLVARRSAPAYFWSHHFKGETPSGDFISREISIPGPVEVLAETALLMECSRHSNFRNPPSVYTYELTQPWDRSGSFVNYTVGLRKRQRAITQACLSADKSSIVRYVDIKKFYPSIRASDASDAWSKLAKPLSSRFRHLGAKLLANHVAAAGSSSRGLLTGPMFSNLIANLVMRDIDDWAGSLSGVEYFRYVDDITFVGPEKLVMDAERILADKLAMLELKLHADDSGKVLTVSTQEWMAGANDFEDDADDLSWRRLIGDLKLFLLVQPNRSNELRAAFLGEGMRIPVPDYGIAATEAPFVETVASLAKQAWYRVRAKGIDVQSLVSSARSLAAKFSAELPPLLDSVRSESGFHQKRNIPKARFRAGRLVYLADPLALGVFGGEASRSPDLRLHAEVMLAASTADVSRVLLMGANAVQSAAQPISAERTTVQWKLDKIGEKEAQGIAILGFNGLRGEPEPLADSSSQSGSLLKLSRGTVGIEMMNSLNPFIREFASLVGRGDKSHSELLSKAFDEADDVVLDAVERLDESSPGGG